MSILIDIPIGLALTYVLFKLYQKWALPAGFPPGPPVLPVLGSILSVGDTPHITFKNWRSKYGDIIGMRMGPMNAVALNNIDLIREAYNDPTFAGAMIPEALAKIFTGGKKRGLIFSEGKDWVEQRRFALRNLRDLGFGKKSMESMVHEDVADVISTIKETAGHPMSPSRTFGLAALSSLWHIVAGERFALNDPKFKDIADQINETQKAASSAGAFALILPWIAETFPELTGLAKFQRAVPATKKLIQGQIDEHKKTFQGDSLRDYMDVYINEMNSRENPESSFYKEKGVENMLIGILNLFEAGAETTSTTVNWAIYYLCKNLEVQKKLQEEVDEVVGSFRLPSLNDRPKMPYTEAVMLEVFRMSSLVPLGVPHATMEDIVFHGYKIPKGTMVFANLYGHHYDEKIWGDSETFRPARFLRSDGKDIARGHPSVVSFSVGKRACLGETLARNNFFLFLTSIFQRFEVTLQSEKKVSGGAFRLPPEMTVTFEDRLNSK